jgi:serine/threonine protein kinase
MHPTLGDAAMADDYHMLEELGSGSFGVVYKAVEKASGDLVAIKHVRPPLPLVGLCLCGIHPSNTLADRKLHRSTSKAATTTFKRFSKRSLS